MSVICTYMHMRMYVHTCVYVCMSICINVYVIVYLCVGLSKVINSRHAIRCTVCIHQIV